MKNLWLIVGINAMLLRQINLMLFGYSEDGIIEAIERKDKKFAVGVQFHPEMIINDSQEAKKIFEEFIKSCINRE